MTKLTIAPLAFLFGATAAQADNPLTGADRRRGQTSTGGEGQGGGNGP